MRLLTVRGREKAGISLFILLKWIITRIKSAFPGILIYDGIADELIGKHDEATEDKQIALLSTAHVFQSIPGKEKSHELLRHQEKLPN